MLMSSKMKKVFGKKLLGVMILFAMIITAVPVIPAQAEDNSEISKTVEVKLFPNRLKTEKIKPKDYYAGFGSGKITNLKNSDKKVATVKKSKTYRGQLEITPKSVGTTKVTYQYGGEKYSLTVNVTNYESPFKSIKIGKKNFTKNFEKSNIYTFKQKKNLTGKLQIKMKKNWKIKSMHLEYYDANYWIRDAKNNKNISLRTDVYDGMTALSVTVQNKKTKEEVDMLLYYSKNAKKNGNSYYP